MNAGNLLGNRRQEESHNWIKRNHLQESMLSHLLVPTTLVDWILNSTFKHSLNQKYNKYLQSLSKNTKKHTEALSF